MPKPSVSSNAPAQTADIIPTDRQIAFEEGETAPSPCISLLQKDPPKTAMPTNETTANTRITVGIALPDEKYPIPESKEKRNEKVNSTVKTAVIAQVHI